MEYQFWLYETGNVNAAISGTGGYEAFGDNVGAVLGDTELTTLQRVTTLAADYPDAAIAIGIAGVVVGAPAIKKAAGAVTHHADGMIDAGATVSAGALLGYAVSQDASWITVSAASFVVGSSFLRYAASNPFFLKLGGLGLAAGGVALTAFGIETGIDAYSNPEVWATITEASGSGEAFVETTRLALPALTAASGAYITSASLLTYEGGMYETSDWRAKHENDTGPVKGWVSKLTHPTKGLLSRTFEKCVDAPVRAMNNAARSTMLRYIPKQMRDTQPFLTSMWARVPWRVVTGAAAIITGNYAFAASNAQWGGGDIMIGLEDCKDKTEAIEGATTEASPE